MPRYHLQNKKKFIGFVLCILLVTALIIVAVILGVKILRRNINNNQKAMNAQDNNLQENNNKQLKYREPAVAGQFYPADKEELEKQIDEYLAQAEIKEPQGKYLPILVLPHAGYEFSGAVAAEGFKQTEGWDINRIIILGRSHKNYFSGVAADTNDIWKTPLGDLEVDRDWIEKIDQENDFFTQDSFSHKYEHSLEVMTPFVKKIFNDKAKIVPLLVGDDDGLDFDKISSAFLENMDNKTLLIVSTDLSHYPDYQTAKDTDRETIEAILKGNLEEFQTKIKELKLFKIGKNNLDTLACAEPSVAIAEKLAEKLEAKGILFKYASSGDAYPETKNRVVGYGAIGFYSDKGLQSSNETEVSTEDANLNQDEQKKALEIARKTIEAKLKNEDYNPESSEGIFQEKRGVFVTLKKDGQLRGCIGNFEPEANLAENIKAMALSAAFDDPRFSPMQNYEWGKIKIEISVLSPMEKINNPEIIEVGKHGVYVRQGIHSGVFLSQVATEAGWNREEFLDNLCENKAGILKDAWRDGSAELYIFTAQVFEEG